MRALYYDLLIAMPFMYYNGMHGLRRWLLRQCWKLLYLLKCPYWVSDVY